mmetsp:Transcript_21235/g.56717  ORF Transcript_21235/g.56717 Transcript_21235/m.56717 type:complete len:262 (-) Transcript_21235:1978-2763(-)
MLIFAPFRHPAQLRLEVTMCGFVTGVLRVEAVCQAHQLRDFRIELLHLSRNSAPLNLFLIVVLDNLRHLPPEALFQATACVSERRCRHVGFRAFLDILSMFHVHLLLEMCLHTFKASDQRLLLQLPSGFPVARQLTQLFPDLQAQISDRADMAIALVSRLSMPARKRRKFLPQLSFNILECGDVGLMPTIIHAAQLDKFLPCSRVNLSESAAGLGTHRFQSAAPNADTIQLFFKGLQASFEARPPVTESFDITSQAAELCL